MQVIPVLDVLNGEAVHAIAGQRSSYRPLKSQLTDSTEPVAVARALAAVCRPSPLYVADLDAIIHQRRDPGLWCQLASAAGPVWLDAGVGDVATLCQVLAIPGVDAILGLESCPDPSWLGEVAREFDPARLIFSVDLQAGRPLTNRSGWRDCTPAGIAREALRCGIRRLIVLDLADVGMSTGGRTAELMQSIQELPECTSREILLYAGGGVRNQDDLARWRDRGAAGVLVATALHRGQIDPTACY